MPEANYGSIPILAAPSLDQDPIFDHANATKTSVTTSAVVITPPAGCKYLRISTDADIYINTAGAAATDGATGGGARIIANAPEVVPVIGGTPVYALSALGTATVRCTPFKAR